MTCVISPTPPNFFIFFLFSIFKLNSNVEHCEREPIFPFCPNFLPDSSSRTRNTYISTYMQETREPIKKIVVQFRLSPLSIISSERGDLTGRGGSYPRLDGCSLTRGCTAKKYVSKIRRLPVMTAVPRCKGLRR